MRKTEKIRKWCLTKKNNKEKYENKKEWKQNKVK